jgi:hypothetical protein
LPVDVDVVAVDDVADPTSADEAWAASLRIRWLPYGNAVDDACREAFSGAIKRFGITEILPIFLYFPLLIRTSVFVSTHASPVHTVAFLINTFFATGFSVHRALNGTSPCSA